MEYTQWVLKFMAIPKLLGLNPCCNGIYSMSTAVCIEHYESTGLNPCCNGIYSMSTGQKCLQANGWTVLILVVMEYTQWVVAEYKQARVFKRLNPCCNGIYSMRLQTEIYPWKQRSLNPCCNGIYSMRGKTDTITWGWFCLNPCCNGIYSMRQANGWTVASAQS